MNGGCDHKTVIGLGSCHTTEMNEAWRIFCTRLPRDSYRDCKKCDSAGWRTINSIVRVMFRPF